jgi:protein-tyrosine phosphatase
MKRLSAIASGDFAYRRCVAYYHGNRTASLGGTGKGESWSCSGCGNLFAQSGDRMARTVLFLCTGNYYRSRYAEALFDALAVERGLCWRADSRGIALELGAGNVGPIADRVIRRLEQQHIHVAPNNRLPLQLQEEDLREADLIIALHEAEHRPLLQRKFPAWADKVEYWQVPDLNQLPAGKAMPSIEHAVRKLILELSESDLQNHA